MVSHHAIKKSISSVPDKWETIQRQINQIEEYDKTLQMDFIAIATTINAALDSGI